MKIVHLKLINGDDIIAKISSENSDEFFVEEPMVLGEREDEYSGKSIIMLSKYVHIPVNTQLKVKKTHVVIEAGLPEEFEKFYEVSVEYNKKVIEPSVNKQIDKVANTMKDLLTNNVESVKFMMLTSNNNSIH